MKRKINFIKEWMPDGNLYVLVKGVKVKVKEFKGDK